MSLQNWSLTDVGWLILVLFSVLTLKMIRGRAIGKALKEATYTFLALPSLYILLVNYLATGSIARSCYRLANMELPHTSDDFRALVSKMLRGEDPRRVLREYSMRQPSRVFKEGLLSFLAFTTGENVIPRHTLRELSLKLRRDLRELEVKMAALTALLYLSPVVFLTGLTLLNLPEYYLWLGVLVQVAITEGALMSMPISRWLRFEDKGAIRSSEFKLISELAKRVLSGHGFKRSVIEVWLDTRSDRLRQAARSVMVGEDLTHSVDVDLRVVGEVSRKGGKVARILSDILETKVELERLLDEFRVLKRSLDLRSRIMGSAHAISLGFLYSAVGSLSAPLLGAPSGRPNVLPFLVSVIITTMYSLEISGQRGVKWAIVPLILFALSLLISGTLMSPWAKGFVGP